MLESSYAPIIKPEFLYLRRSNYTEEKCSCAGRVYTTWCSTPFQFCHPPEFSTLSYETVSHGYTASSRPSKDTLIFTVRYGRFFGALLRGKRYDRPRELLYSRSWSGVSTNPTRIPREKESRKMRGMLEKPYIRECFSNSRADKYRSTKVYAKLKNVNNVFYRTHTFYQLVFILFFKKLLLLSL